MSSFVCFHGHKLQGDDKTPAGLAFCSICGSTTHPDLGHPLGGSTAFAAAGQSGLLETMGADERSMGMLETLGPDAMGVAMAGDLTLASRDASGSLRLSGTQSTTVQEAGVFVAPRLDGLTVLRELGRGGMGVVYLARDERQERDVALKTLQRLTPLDLIRFKQEFRALADIAHPNLASLYELLSDGETWCLTMELLDGVDFLEYVWSGCRERSEEAEGVAAPVTHRLTAERLERLRNGTLQILAGLSSLHAHRKLHCDIKPSNVLVDRQGRLVLLDFGLVAEIDANAAQRQVQGSPMYMSPEQASLRPLSTATDMYALGTMLYETLTGFLPIRDQPLQTMLRKQSEVPPAPSLICEGVPPELDQLCLALLSPDPAQRPTVAEVRAILAPEDSADMGPLPATLHGGLVGRLEHLRTLRTALDEVIAGDARAVFVRGLSGMGKTQVVHHFLTLAAAEEGGAVVLRGRCYEAESVPFKALDSLVDSLTGYLRELSSSERSPLIPEDSLPLARLFPVFESVAGIVAGAKPQVATANAKELRRRGSVALRELLLRLARLRPLVLFIDDLQWGDVDSMALLADILRPPVAPRILLLGTYRQEDAETSPALAALAEEFGRGEPPPHRLDLAVSPLSDSEALALAEQLLASRGGHDAEAAKRIASESGGSPFFIWEVAQHLTTGADGVLATSDLTALIRARVHQLPADARGLLELVAVAGRPIPVEAAFEAVDAHAAGPRLLRQLRAAHYVRTSGDAPDVMVESYHDRFREAVAGNLSDRDAAGHFGRLAAALETRLSIGEADLLAHLSTTPHFEEPTQPLSVSRTERQRIFDLADFHHQAGDDAAAHLWALVGAEIARTQNALEAAARMYEVARSGVGPDATAIRFRILEGLGDVLVLQGAYERALPRLREAHQLAQGQMVRARLAGKLGNLLFKSGDMVDSATAYEDGLATLGQPAPGYALTRGLGMLKEALVQVLHTWLPARLTGRASSTTGAFAEDTLRGFLYDGLAYPYWFTVGPVPTLWAHLRHMNLLERYGPSQVLGRAYSMHAILMTALPLAERGVRYADRAYAIHQALDDRLGQGKARSFKAFSLLTLGRFPEGVAAGEEAMALLDQAGDVWEANMARMIFSQPLYYSGDLGAAARASARSYAVGMETGDYAAAAIALCFWAPADPTGIPEGALQEECDRARNDPKSSAAALLGYGLERLLRYDDPLRAAESIDASLQLARRKELRDPCIFCGVSWRATAFRMAAQREPEGASRQRATSAARRAVRQALWTTRTYLTSRTRALRERAMIAIMEGDPSTARRYFDESLALAEVQGARAEHAETLFERARAGEVFQWVDAAEQLGEARAALRAIGGRYARAPWQASD